MMRLGTALHVLAASLFAALLLIFALLWLPNGGVSDDDAARLRLFLLWTNIFYLWPTLSAVTKRAWAEAAVFFVTFFVSTAHHGCHAARADRDPLAVGTLALLLIGGVALFAALAASLGTLLAQLRRDPADPFWLRRATALLVGGTALLVVIVTVVLAVAINNAPAAIDGCLYAHGTDATSVAHYEERVADLAALWQLVDFVTAVAAISIIVIFFLQLRDDAALGVFWALAVTVLVTQLLERADLLERASSLAVVLTLTVVFVAARLTVCCAYRAAYRETLLRRYTWLYAVLATALGVGALVLFLEFDSATVHGWWHVLGSVALYVALEALHV